MARPSQNLDQKLLELGKEKIVTQGIANLSVRQICLDAGINLGMFYYYFKTKENYIKAIFKSLSDDMTESWTAETQKLSTSEQKLKKALFMNAKMMKEHRGMIEIIIKDTNIFDKMYIEIGRGLYDRLMKFYTELMDECKNDGYLDKNIDTDILISSIAGSVHNYAKHCEFNDYSEEEYYNRITNMIDFIIGKFK
jgi:AcrR family transcriptional regulator